MSVATGSRSVFAALAPTVAPFLLLVLSGAAAPPAAPPEDELPVPGVEEGEVTSAVLTSSFRLIREKSVHRARVDWDEAERRFHEEVARQTTAEGKLSAFRSLFERMDDVHSSVVYRGRQFGYFRPASEAETARVAPLIERAGRQGGRVAGRMLDRGVAYLVIPTISASGPDEVNGHAAAIRTKVCELAGLGATSWILDLRLNMGGNMHPMLTGLGSLIGEGDLGGIVDPDGRPKARWAIHGGILHVNGSPTASIDAGCRLEASPSIAVLLGPITMSSGQIVAVALAGRPAARSFGETTADGYATANEWHQLTPDLALNLSVGFLSDRTGRVYRGVVEPDVPVSGADDFESPSRDPKVRVAEAWLVSQRARAQGSTGG